jgi:hypothetical protein
MQTPMRSPLPALAAALVIAATGACSLDRLTARPLPEPTRSDFPSKETRKGTKFWPISAPVDQGATYEFNSGHCGLDYLTDFDGSFWRPVDPNGAAEDPPFFYNEDEGTMVLLRGNRAMYESSDGQEIRLHRIPGPVVVEGLCG